MRIHINEIKEHIGEVVTIAGFVQIIRDQGSIKFLLIRDITGVIQVVVLKSEKEAMDVVQSLSMESVVEITGLAKEEKQAPQGFEVSAQNIKVLSHADPSFLFLFSRREARRRLSNRSDLIGGGSIFASHGRHWCLKCGPHSKRHSGNIG